MMITIYHLDKETYRNSLDIFRDNKREEFCLEAIKNYNYNEVVTYNIIGTDHDEFLNDAFKITNSTDCYWGDNFLDGVDEGNRSTSVCDIIKVDGTLYMVAGAGFIRLKGNL